MAWEIGALSCPHQRKFVAADRPAVNLLLAATLARCLSASRARTCLAAPARCPTFCCLLYGILSSLHCDLAPVFHPNPVHPGTAASSPCVCAVRPQSVAIGTFFADPRHFSTPPISRASCKEVSAASTLQLLLNPRHPTNSRRRRWFLSFLPPSTHPSLTHPSIHQSTSSFITICHLRRRRVHSRHSSPCPALLP